MFTVHVRVFQTIIKTQWGIEKKEKSMANRCFISIMFCAYRTVTFMQADFHLCFQTHLAGLVHFCMIYACFYAMESLDCEKLFLIVVHSYMQAYVNVHTHTHKAQWEIKTALVKENFITPHSAVHKRKTNSSAKTILNSTDIYIPFLQYRVHFTWKWKYLLLKPFIQHFLVY